MVEFAAVELGLSQPTYRVVEGQILRRYEVCMEVFGEDGDCIIPFPFIVYISTIDRTGNPFVCTKNINSGLCYSFQLIHLQTT